MVTPVSGPFMAEPPHNSNNLGADNGSCWVPGLQYTWSHFTSHLNSVKQEILTWYIAPGDEGQQNANFISAIINECGQNGPLQLTPSGYQFVWNIINYGWNFFADEVQAYLPLNLIFHNHGPASEADFPASLNDLYVLSSLAVKAGRTVPAEEAFANAYQALKGLPPFDSAIMATWPGSSMTAIFASDTPPDAATCAVQSINLLSPAPTAAEWQSFFQYGSQLPNNLFQQIIEDYCNSQNPSELSTVIATFLQEADKCSMMTRSNVLDGLLSNPSMIFPCVQYFSSLIKSAQNPTDLVNQLIAYTTTSGNVLPNYITLIYLACMQVDTPTSLSACASSLIALYNAFPGSCQFPSSIPILLLPNVCQSLNALLPIMAQYNYRGPAYFNMFGELLLKIFQGDPVNIPALSSVLSAWNPQSAWGQNLQIALCNNAVYNLNEPLSYFIQQFVPFPLPSGETGGDIVQDIFSFINSQDNAILNGNPLMRDYLHLVVTLAEGTPPPGAFMGGFLTQLMTALTSSPPASFAAACQEALTQLFSNQASLGSFLPFTDATISDIAALCSNTNLTGLKEQNFLDDCIDYAIRQAIPGDSAADIAAKQALFDQRLPLPALDTTDIGSWLSQTIDNNKAQLGSLTQFFNQMGFVIS